MITYQLTSPFLKFIQTHKNLLAHKPQSQNQEAHARSLKHHTQNALPPPQNIYNTKKEKTIAEAIHEFQTQKKRN